MAEAFTHSHRRPIIYSVNMCVCVCVVCVWGLWDGLSEFQKTRRKRRHLINIPLAVVRGRDECIIHVISVLKKTRIFQYITILQHIVVGGWGQGRLEGVRAACAGVATSTSAAGFGGWVDGCRGSAQILNGRL